MDNPESITSFDENDIESMVTYYFASRIRGDKKWKEVLPPEEEWNGRMKRKIEKHNGWKFLDFKNLGYSEGKYGQYVKVHVTIEYKGRQDGGEDEVEVSNKSGKWQIVSVPT